MKQGSFRDSGTSFDTMEAFKEDPDHTGNGNIIYMEDVANIYNTVEAKDSIGRYDGKDTMTIGVKKNQDSDHITVSKAVHGDNANVKSTGSVSGVRRCQRLQ